MKHRIIIVTLTLALLLTGCGAPTEETPAPDTPDTPELIIDDSEVIYEDTLSDIAVLFSTERTGDVVGEEDEGLSGVREIIMYQEDAASHVGYAYRDLNGNGKKELLIGKISETHDGKNLGDSILAVYSADSGKVTQVLEGWARSRYNIRRDNTFFHSGSSGAAYSVAGWYEVSDDGTELNCRDFYFTDLDENGEATYYHNTTGEGDTKRSIQLDIDEVAFWGLVDRIAFDVEAIELTPFDTMMYQYVERTGGKWLTVNRISDTDNDSDSEVVILNASDFATNVVFTPHAEISDFRILEISISPTDDGEGIFFDHNVIYETDTLEAPLTVRLAFYGDIPNNGVAFKDADGCEHVYCIGESFRDDGGSIMLSDISDLLRS